MKKDIQPPAIKNVAVAIVEEKNELQKNIWNVYLINLSNHVLDGVLVSSKGYIKDLKGKDTKTSLLRHSLGTVKPQSFVKIEPIIETLFSLHNEYWVSFFKNNQMLDKKYIFLAETIKKENFVKVPLINKFGVMIK